MLSRIISVSISFISIIIGLVVFYAISLVLMAMGFPETVFFLPAWWRGNLVLEGWLAPCFFSLLLGAVAFNACYYTSLKLGHGHSKASRTGIIFIALVGFKFLLNLGLLLLLLVSPEHQVNIGNFTLYMLPTTVKGSVLELMTVLGCATGCSIVRDKNNA